MTDKQLMKNFTGGNPHWDFQAEISFTEANKRSLSNTYPKIVLASTQLNKEAQKLKLYFRLFELEPSFKNYKNWIIQESALRFLSNIQRNVERGKELKNIKNKIKRGF